MVEISGSCGHCAFYDPHFDVCCLTVPSRCPGFEVRPDSKLALCLANGCEACTDRFVCHGSPYFCLGVSDG